MTGITIHHADCLTMLATLPADSFDSCVTDPPYHLVSIVKRFSNATADDVYKNAELRKTFNQGGSPYARQAKGFMGKQWDGGDIASRVETWAEVYRVLKPGAHLVAFGGTRTYHRMVCAIEDAGFEIRDCIQWIYGSGFPKSHDVSKGVDRTLGAEGGYGDYKTAEHNRTWKRESRHEGWARPWMDDAEANEKYARQYVGGTDEARQWQGWGTALKPACEPIVLARKPLSEGSIAANVLRWGTGALNIDGCRVPTGQTWENEQSLCISCAERVASTTKHSTQETKEFIAISHAEQTLSAKDDPNQPDIFKTDIGCSDGTRTENTFTSLNTEKFGNGTTDQSQTATKSTTSTETRATTGQRICDACGVPITHLNTPFIKRGMNGEPLPLQGRANIGARWPANVVHDGSDEVVQGFPDTTSGDLTSYQRANRDGYAGPMPAETNFERDGDSGSAARFFYTAKANGDERIGSKHPTVKPIDLMQWLVRLVTPPRGCVLDPFAGTGTTGEAAWREGMRAVLVEREAEYVTDIKRRLELMQAGPDERSREIVKATGKTESHETLPLFGFNKGG